MQSIEDATVFVFPGQPDPWPGAAFAAVGELLRSGSPFGEAMNRCAEALAEFVGWSLMEVVHRAVDGADPGHPDVWQPVHFAVMVSLAAQWRAAGVTPDAVIGVSYGEIAAAHVAGALTLREAARLATAPANLIAGYGTPDSLDFETLRATLLGQLAGLRPRSVDTVFISTVTGAALDTAILDGEYWFANLRQPPLIEHAVQWAYGHGYHLFVESSPNPMVAAGVRGRSGQDSASLSAHARCPARPSDVAVSRYRPNNAG